MPFIITCRTHAVRAFESDLIYDSDAGGRCRRSTLAAALPLALALLSTRKIIEPRRLLFDAAFTAYVPITRYFQSRQPRGPWIIAASPLLKILAPKMFLWLDGSRAV